MRITFQNQGIQDNDRQYAERAVREKQARTEKVQAAAVFAGSEESWLSGKDGKEKSRTLADIQQEAGNVNVAVRQDYMTVLSNTVSEEDYARMQEEGFRLSDMTPEETVTIVDKIKAELARSGQHIAGYTDDLDQETLAAAVGSEVLAGAIAESFRAADVPLTEENLRDVSRAWEMMSCLQTPDEGVYRYMVDNGMDPELWNFYLAQSSTAESMPGGAPRYYAEDIKGYFTQSAGGSKDGGLQGQIDKIIEDAGLPLSDESRQKAAWLMEQGLPLTAEHLQRLQDLQAVSLPMSEEVFAQVTATAVANGRAPQYADLTNQENIYRKAASLTDEMVAKWSVQIDAEDIAGRKQLEEIRLRMTAEVNVKLLKSGFAIDTAPMEAFLAKLEEVEQQLADSYFPGAVEASVKYDLFRQTNQVMAEIPALPIQMVGIRSVGEQGTVKQFHEEGIVLREQLERAKEGYETLMTAPRKDMGDSIRKAFANVDAILEDLGLELNEGNRRATRILGYNRMDITVENLETVKVMDERIRSVVDKMTPATALKMIREGINPLETDFEGLEQYLNGQNPGYEEEAESYSRFLYKLEQNKEITPEEREAYIGIFRLIRQIEKSDGAVAGALVNTGAELQFSNLLSAVRSNRFRHMDVQVTDETGLMSELVRGEKSISEQISSGMLQMARDVVTEVSQNEEADALYRKQELAQLREAAKAGAESAALLERSDLPTNASNLMAAQMLTEHQESPFKKWREQAERFGYREAFTALAGLCRETEEMPDEASFREHYQDALQNLSEHTEQATLDAADSSVDVKELQLVHKQMSVAMAVSNTQEYIIPMMIGEEPGRVHLTFVKDDAAKGYVDVSVDFGENSHVEAHLKLNGNVIEGILAGNTQEEVTKLQQISDIFHELIKEDASVEWEVGQLPIVKGGDKGLRTAVTQADNTPVDTTELYGVARRFLQAIGA